MSSCEHNKHNGQVNMEKMKGGSNRHDDTKVERDQCEMD